MGSMDCCMLLKALERLQLSPEEIDLLRTFLAIVTDPDGCLALIEAAAGRRPCPRRGCNRCHRNGKANGLQRYRCTGCGASFNALTGTPLARLRPRDKWPACLLCVLESTTVRAAATRVVVAKSTSFRWRHRFIAAVRREQWPSLSGIVEVDETYHLESQKGSRQLGSRQLDRPARKRGGMAARRGLSRERDCILVARDRNRITHDFVTGRGPVTARQLAARLLPVLAADVLLISDEAKAYEVFARQASRTRRSTSSAASGRAARSISRM